MENKISAVKSADRNEYTEQKSSSDRRRSFERGSLWYYVVRGFAVSLALFHFITAGIGTLPIIKQANIHLGMVLFLVFLYYPVRAKSPKNRMNPVDVLLGLTSLAVNAFMFYEYDLVARRSGMLTNIDIIIGVLLILLILEACRRTSGIALPLLMCFALFYCFYGQIFPGFLHHGGLRLKRIMQYMVWGTEGVFGVSLSVSCTFLFLFILFGSVLEETGLAKFINDLALSVAGGARGGPAKVATVASACMGTISGSNIANVATTGVFTIPMMKKAGFKPIFAAAVEAVASTGGMVMPPIMASTAFIMAEFLGVSYLTIIKSAVIPAVLYYVAVWVVIDLEARRLKIPLLDKEKLPRLWNVLKSRGYLAIPIFTLIYFMMAGRTTMFAAFYSILISVALAFFRKETRMTLKKILSALESASLSALSVACACASVGIMIATVSATGLSLVLGDGLIALSGGNLYITLILTMITAIIMGMGLPTTACYIVTSTVAAPALLKLGVAPLVAHFFVFYYGIMSGITPPVALASFTAAGLVGESPTKVGYASVRLALAIFGIPFIFVASPDLLMIDPVPWMVAIKCVTATVGAYSIGIAVVGYMFAKVKPYERILSFAGGVMLMHSGFETDIAGVVLMAFILSVNYMRSKREELVLA